jgi:hypothetical protein
MCISPNPFVIHELGTHFGIHPDVFMDLSNNFCIFWVEAYLPASIEACRGIKTGCDPFEYSVNQWFYWEVLLDQSYTEISYKNISGYFEFYVFDKYFKAHLDNRYKDQFQNVKFRGDKEYFYLLETRNGFGIFIQ